MKLFDLREGERVKRCPHCKETKRVSPHNPRRSDFARGSGLDRGEPRMSSWCRECAAARKRNPHHQPVVRDVTDDYGVVVRVRRCAECLVWQDEADNFYRRPRGGYLSYCRPCRAALARRNHALKRDDRNAKQRARLRRRRQKADPFLPIAPFREWVEATIRRLEPDSADEVFRDTVNTGLARFTRELETGTDDTRETLDRKIYRWRYEVKLVRLSDADFVLTTFGEPGALHDLWPDWDAAVAEGVRLKSGGKPEGEEQQAA